MSSVSLVEFKEIEHSDQELKKQFDCLFQGKRWLWHQHRLRSHCHNHSKSGLHLPPVLPWKAMSRHADDPRDQKSYLQQLVHDEERKLSREEVVLATEVISNACGWACGWVADQHCCTTTQEVVVSDKPNWPGCLSLTTCVPQQTHIFNSLWFDWGTRMSCSMRWHGYTPGAPLRNILSTLR